MNTLEHHIPAVVEHKEGSVEITFSESIPRDLLETQLKECQAGT